MVDLGLSSSYFYSLTPAQFSALWKRHQWREYNRQLIPALQLVWITNALRDREAHPLPFMLHEFLPHPDGVIPELREEHRQTVEEQIAAARLLTEAFEGIIDHGRRRH